jgi:hypothetical protein
MLTSLRYLAPDDSEEVGTRVADFLETAGWTALIVAAAVLVLTLVFSIVIARKAGYSGWWGALAALVPGLGFILFLLFAMLKWPSLKERDEAIGVIEANDLMLPSRERAAVREAERRKQIEEDARRRMEQARIDREKAEAESARYRRAQAADESAASPAAAPAAAPAATPAARPEKKLADPSAAKPADAPAAKPSDAPAVRPVAKPADSAADAPAVKPADAPAKRAATPPPATKPEEPKEG